MNERDVFFRARDGSGNEPDDRHRRSRVRRSRRKLRRRKPRRERERPRVADPAPPVRRSFVTQIVCVNTAACLFAGRFGLAPTVNKNYGGAESYGKMVEAERPRVQSRDPAGFTIVDVAAWGSLAHIISAGEILGQKAAGFF